MPTQPGRSDVHVNRPLTNISLAFVQDDDNFVAGRIFPNIPVGKQSDLYFTYDRDEFNRDEMKERAPGTESAGGTYKIGRDNYFARIRAYHRDVPDPVRANQDDAISLDREATIFVTGKALINREKNWVTSYFTAGDPADTWTFDVDGASTASGASFDPTDAANNQVVFWDNPASTPIEDVRRGKRFVLESTGFKPNKITLGRAVFDALLDHPDIVGRIDRGQTRGAAIANREAIAALFELDEVLVMDAIETTSVEGAATAARAFIGGPHALLAYAAPSPGLMTPSAGYTFSWTGLLGNTPDGMRIKRFRMEHLESDRVEIDSTYDQKLVSADLGYFFGNIVELP